VLSDTFGENDKRKKLINLLKKNYKENKCTTIISKKLSLNLLNVLDIYDAVNLILKKILNPTHIFLKIVKTIQ
jgi:hypothetical protein